MIMQYGSSTIHLIIRLRACSKITLVLLLQRAAIQGHMQSCCNACCAGKRISLVFSRDFPLKCSHVPQVKNGDYVGVSLSGVTNATTYDAVAIYVHDPSGDAVGLNKLLKYKWANEDLTYVTTGKTSFRYRSLSWNATQRRDEKGRPCKFLQRLKLHTCYPAK